MDYTKINEKELLKWLQENLSEKRFVHSLGTAECAKDLAVKFKQNPEKAYMAGLLHDCAKCFSNEKLMEIIENHLNVEKIELMNYKHSMLLLVLILRKMNLELMIKKFYLL